MLCGVPWKVDRSSSIDHPSLRSIFAARRPRRMPRILFIASHRPERSPGQRFRFEQYLGALEKAGWEHDHSHLVNAEDDKILYQRGNYFDKARFVRRCHRIRQMDVARMQSYDVIFLYREALMTRSIRYELKFRKSKAKLIFDFDDSVWLPNVSEANRRWSWMKDASKTSKLIGLSDIVFAGNAYLADYAKPFNPNTLIVPTTIDTDEYLPKDFGGGDPRSSGSMRGSNSGPVVIGWSGSITTIQHFKYAIPALKVLREKYGDRIAIRVIGDGSYTEASLGVQGLPWKKATELDDLRAMDIGIMPLPDDEWARGKCGLKGLQYMALGLPTIMSPVGVNSEIIQDGKDGFLATSTEEWVAKISRLVDDAELRKQMGAGARKTVVDRYSLQAWQDRYVSYYDRLIGR
jgi:glycosyltransferase involved in cell wall biosynthesis